MSKFDILDDWLKLKGAISLHPIFFSHKICFVGFQMRSSFCNKNLSSIQDVMKIWDAF